MTRQPKIKILMLTSRNFWLLIIPLLRGLISLRFDLYHWIQGAWLDILVILVILGSAYLRWYRTTYIIGENSLRVETGVFAHSSYTISYESVCAVLAEEKFLLRPFKAVNLNMDTNAGIANTADLKLTIRKSEMKALFSLLDKKEANAVRTSYRPSRINLVLFSVLFSSTLSGIILFSTLLIRSGKILGTSLLEVRLMKVVTDAAQKIAPILPPIAVGISLLLLTGWLISFVGNLLRHIGFTIRRHGTKIRIRNGFFTKRRYFIQSNRINYADLRQNLLMKLFSVMSVHVNCSGYGKMKNEIPVFLPVTTKQQVYGSLRLLLPGMEVLPGGIKPRGRYFTRYLWLPFYAMLIIPAAGLVLNYFFPLWHSLIFFLTVMAEIPFLWLFAVKLTAFLTTRIAMNEKQLCLTYSFGYAFHKIIIPRDKIAKVTITQSIFQRVTKACDVRIFATNEFTKRHKIIAMPLGDVEELFKGTEFEINIDGFKK